MSPDLPLVHLHAQPGPHEEAFIVGTREGLRALAAALAAALARGAGQAELFAADGEAYTAHVLLEAADWDSSVWRRAALPYRDPAFAETRPEAVWPWRRVASRELGRSAG